MFCYKLDVDGNVLRYKKKLIVKGHNQQEGINSEETYALVARLEAIRMFLDFSCIMNFKLFQMNVKSVFLNGYIQEEILVNQPPDFIIPSFPNHDFKL